MLIKQMTVYRLWQLRCLELGNTPKMFSASSASLSQVVCSDRFVLLLCPFYIPFLKFGPQLT